MLRALTWFIRRRSYQPLNKIILSRVNLRYNYKYLSRVNPRLKIAPVLKSNAYGHGIVEVARVLDKLGTPFFCVDSIFEAYQLYKAKVKTPILIMGYIDPKNLIKKLPFQYSVWDMSSCKGLNSNNWVTKIHIFVDTGMGREGVRIEELESFLKEVRNLKNLEIVGLMSHFASANLKNSSQTKLQIRKFSQALKICQKLGINPKYKHISASAGLFSTKNLDCNIARIGKALYGIDPMDSENSNLRPVLKFTSKIVQIKQLQKGDSVGYEGTYRAKKRMLIGILPVGYNDGLDRRLSNRGVVRIGEANCNIIGMVSMNITAISLENAKDAQVGDTVIIYSDISSEANSIQNTAKLLQTTPYDIMVNLVSTTRREVLD